MVGVSGCRRCVCCAAPGSTLHQLLMYGSSCVGRATLEYRKWLAAIAVDWVGWQLEEAMAPQQRPEAWH